VILAFRRQLLTFSNYFALLEFKMAIKTTAGPDFDGNWSFGEEIEVQNVRLQFAVDDNPMTYNLISILNLWPRLGVWPCLTSVVIINKWACQTVISCHLCTR